MMSMMPFVKISACVILPLTANFVSKYFQSPFGNFKCIKRVEVALKEASIKNNNSFVEIR